MRLLVTIASEPVDEVVGRPGARQLHEAFPHHGAGGGEFVLIPLDIFTVDEVGNVEDHLAVFGEAAADLFVEGHKQPVHLETDGAGTGLALAGAGSVFAQIGKILSADALRGQMALDFFRAAVVNKDL